MKLTDEDVQARVWPEYLKTEQALEYLQCSRSTLYALHAKGVIKRTKFGGIVRWPLHSLRAFFQKRERTR